MVSFRRTLERKLFQSQFNDYGIENFDENRFGILQREEKCESNAVLKLKRVIKKVIKYKKEKILRRHDEFFSKYEHILNQCYEQYNKDGKKLFIEILAYRLLGYRKVKLSRNNKEYKDAIHLAKSLIIQSDAYNPHFLHFMLYKCELIKIGYDVSLYFTHQGVAIDFILEQYSYKLDDKTSVKAEEGDIVMDLGACWGDTALYFACKTGETGKVYSFEFIPENITLFNLNLSLNTKLIKQIELIKNPVSNVSGKKIYFNENGPGSRIEVEPFEDYKGCANTISIDDFVKEKNIQKVDFIKMDIEGAELLALEGAIDTIKKYKPKLAIAIYHSMDDFVNIPVWILGLKIGYKLYIDHYTIHTEETILFAKVER